MAVLAAVAIAGSGLAACSSDAGPPSLTWYINPDAGGQATIAKQCTDDAGGRYRLQTSLLPRESSSQREQLVRRLAANDASIDIMSLDPPFIPEFAQAGFLADVPADVAKATTDDVVRSSVEGSTWNGKLVAVPFWANTQLLWYRKSAAKAAGLDLEQPVTWNQLIDAAQKARVHLAVQGIRAEALTVWINALVASAGGTIVENPTASPEDLKLGLQTQAGREAAGIVNAIASKGLAGPAFSTQNEDASRAQFESGAAGFMVNWPFVWPAANDSVKAGTLKSSVVDDYAWAEYPRVDASRESAPPYGGINLGVGAFSKNRELAFEAVSCIVSAEHQAYYFVSNGNPAAKRSVYDDPEVLKAFPMAPTIAASLDHAAPRPQTPYYNEVSQALQRTWHPPTSVDPDRTPASSSRLITAVLHKEDLL